MKETFERGVYVLGNGDEDKFWSHELDLLWDQCKSCEVNEHFPEEK
jgi:hypothetical protein